MDETAWLHERVERILGPRSLEAWGLVPRALVGFEAAATSGGDARLIRRAVEKLRAGDRLLPAERQALEVGLRMARPASIIEGGRLPETLTLSDTARAVISAQLPGIASVGWEGELSLGTAFQVAPRVLVTSAHVANLLLKDGAGRCVARFDADPWRAARVICVEGILVCHPREDVALLRMASTGPCERGLRLVRDLVLSRADPLLAVGHPISSEGHPPWVDGLFENIYGVKRISPGEVLGQEGTRLFHDCTTLAGNSGSPLFDARTGLVVGIHATGRFAWRNSAVSTCALHVSELLRENVVSWA